MYFFLIIYYIKRKSEEIKRIGGMKEQRYIAGTVRYSSSAILIKISNLQIIAENFEMKVYKDYHISI